MSSTAEAISEVVADLRNGRVRPLNNDGDLFRNALQLIETSTVVDATAIYESLVAKETPVYLYEDHPCISPPWESALICYVNGHGNVIVMQSMAIERPKERWETHQPIDWDRVRWALNTFVWVGGESDRSGPMPTSGPAHAWQYAIYEDGQPADLRWIQLLPKYALETWEMAQLTHLEALNFCNCRNVELVEPRRPRAEARRIARAGVQVKTINVFPVGRSVRSARQEGEVGVPLTSVRGHFAHYGPTYERGLLFGKYEGRFWIPQHARGDASLGETESIYALRADVNG